MALNFMPYLNDPVRKPSGHEPLTSLIKKLPSGSPWYHKVPIVDERDYDSTLSKAPRGPASMSVKTIPSHTGPATPIADAYDINWNARHLPDLISIGEAAGRRTAAKAFEARFVGATAGTEPAPTLAFADQALQMKLDQLEAYKRDMYFKGLTLKQMADDPVYQSLEAAVRAAERLKVSLFGRPDAMQQSAAAMGFGSIGNFVPGADVPSSGAEKEKWVEPIPMAAAAAGGAGAGGGAAADVAPKVVVNADMKNAFAVHYDAGAMADLTAAVQAQKADHSKAVVVFNPRRNERVAHTIHRIFPTIPVHDIVADGRFTAQGSIALTAAGTLLFHLWKKYHESKGTLPTDRLEEVEGRDRSIAEFAESAIVRENVRSLGPIYAALGAALGIAGAFAATAAAFPVGADVVGIGALLGMSGAIFGSEVTPRVVEPVLENVLDPHGPIAKASSAATGFINGALGPPPPKPVSRSLVELEDEYKRALKERKISDKRMGYKRYEDEDEDEEL